VNFRTPPITIVSRGNDTVTFEVSQTITNSTLCLFGTYYESQTNSFVCQVEDSVGPGAVGTHTAICHGGEAHVELYIYDEMVSSSGNVNVPDECYPVEPGENTIKLMFILPCATWDWCPSLDNLKCTDVQPYITEGDFESAGEIENWIFATEGAGGPTGNHFLLLDGSHTETFSTFDVPTDGSSLEVEFELYEQNGWSVDDIFYLRINTNYLDIGPFDSASVEESSNDYFNDIYVAIQGLYESRNKVFLTIPSTWFGEYGRLTLGMRIILSTQLASVGIDNFKLSATCGVSSASAATTLSCAEGGTGDIMSTHFEDGLPETVTWTNALVSEWDSSWTSTVNGGTTYGGKFLGRMATADNLDIGMDIAIDPSTTPYIQLEFDVYTIDYVQPAYRLELKVRTMWMRVPYYMRTGCTCGQCIRDGRIKYINSYIACFCFPN
jgi:hypothetical protein